MDKFEQLKQAVQSYVKKYDRRLLLLTISLAIALFAWGLYCMTSDKNWQADEVVTALLELHPDLTVVKIDETESQDLALDPILSKAYFKDRVLQLDENEFAGCVEVYANHQEALLRKQYLEALGNEKIALVNEDNFGKGLAQAFEKQKEHLYANGNVLLRLNGKYSIYQANQLIDETSGILKQKEQKEKAVPDHQEIARRKEMNLKRAKEDALKAKADLEKKIDENLQKWRKEAETADIYGLVALLDKVESYRHISSVQMNVKELRDFIQTQIDHISLEIDEALDELENSLDQQKLDQIKTQVEGLTHEIFEEHQKDWHQRIEEVQWKINNQTMTDYKAVCQTYDYDELLNYPEQYQEAFVYYRGKVSSITHTIEGQKLQIEITPVSLFSFSLYWEDPIEVTLDQTSGGISEEGSIIHVWGQITGVTDVPTWFGQTKKMPKMRAKYIEIETQ